jgi:hypothetical protein
MAIVYSWLLAGGIILVLAVINSTVIYFTRHQVAQKRMWYLAGLVMFEIVAVLLSLILLKFGDFYDHKVFIIVLSVGFIILLLSKFLVFKFK